MDFKGISNKALCKEFIKEDNYIRENGGTMDNNSYNAKMEYIRSIREELFKRGYTNFSDIKQNSK